MFTFVSVASEFDTLLYPYLPCITVRCFYIRLCLEEMETRLSKFSLIWDFFNWREIRIDWDITMARSISQWLMLITIAISISNSLMSLSHDCMQLTHLIGPIITSLILRLLLIIFRHLICLLYKALVHYILSCSNWKCLLTAEWVHLSFYDWLLAACYQTKRGN